MRTGQRRYTVMAWRRRLAYQESLALRHLYRAHGTLPKYAHNNWQTA